VTKLLLLVVALSVVGCAAHAPRRVVEAPDPSVGDLRCHAPQLAVSEWLYNAPGPAQCAED